MTPANLETLRQRLGIKPVSDQELAAIDASVPQSITLDLPNVVGYYLAAQAHLDDRTPEYIALKILKEIASKAFDDAERICKSLEDRFASDGEPIRADATERQAEGLLADELRVRGLTVETQVNTGAGVADIVIYSADKAIGVVEVKLELSGWREAHRAFGQAKAYACALGARHAWVAAPTTDRKLLTKKAPHILQWDTAAETIHKRFGGPQAVPSEG